jgi:hypothetical protein
MTSQKTNDVGSAVQNMPKNTSIDTDTNTNVINTQVANPNMNQRQWQEVEAIVRKEQERSLQCINNARYYELAPILDQLYKLAYAQE